MIHVWLPPGCQGFLSRPPLLRTGADLVEIACLREELLYRSGVFLKTPTPALKQAPDQVSPNITLSTRRARVGEDPRRQLSDREPETPLPDWVHYSRVEKAHACAKHTATMLPTSHYLTVPIRVLPSIGDVLIRVAT